jgi:hypothetical protein
MKRVLFVLFAISIAGALYAQSSGVPAGVPEYRFASGRWGFSGDRLYQNDAAARLAKVNIQVAQSGPMVYEFNARYEGGAEDGHGGFGLHVFGDRVYNDASWGSGNSYLLWLNYDERPISAGIPRGLSAQVYKSVGNSRMNLVESISLSEFEQYLTAENLSGTLPVKIWIDGSTGEIRVYDPTDPTLTSYYYYYITSRDVPLRGNWIALRTNGLKASFGLGL